MIDISPEDDLDEVEAESENIDGPLANGTIIELDDEDETEGAEVLSPTPQELEDGNNAAFTFGSGDYGQN